MGDEKTIGRRDPLEEQASQAGDSLLEGLGCADHQIEATLISIQVPQESVRIDAEVLEYGWYLVRDLAPLVWMDCAAAPVHQLQVIVIGEWQAVLGFRGSRKREQFRDGLLQGFGLVGSTSRGCPSTTRARKIWHQLRREGLDVARCTVERLMRKMGIQGVSRGAYRRTTRPAPITVCPDDLVRRRFSAGRPNQLWVADLTYVPTWVGFVYTAVVIDVFAKRIVGWKTARSMTTSLVLDALEQALHARGDCDGLIHHSDRGVQYLSIRYTQRLTDAGIDGSVGSTGNSYDNALAETIIGLYKTEVIHHQGFWREARSVEYATPTWIDWFNHRRLLGSIGHVPPAELEVAYY